MYSVKLEIFEGPLDLLLHLVDKNKLDITEISLTKICGEYEDYLTKIRDLNLEVESSFITVFASLLEIKSKLLLPVVPIEKEEEKPPSEHELVLQLKEYKKFKELAVEIGKKAKEHALCHPRPDCTRDEQEEIIFASQLNAQDLMNYYVAALRRMNRRESGEDVMEMPREELSFPLIFKIIQKKIKIRGSAWLHELFDTPPDRVRFVVTFLVILEMARRRKIILMQNPGEFEINIVKRSQVRQDYDVDLAG
ncbi:MAG: segregation/condensation protein A [Firmicutes bacterium]|nr:segregation/condensation protein A [Bacillota bacterium]